MLRKKGILKNFANFTGKNLCRNLFLTKLQVWMPFFKNIYFEKHLRTTASVKSKITVNPKDNGFTITVKLSYSFMLQRNYTKDISLENLQDFVRLFWMAASKVIAKEKNTFSASIKVTISASIDAILMPFISNDLTNRK